MWSDVEIVDAYVLKGRNDRSEFLCVHFHDGIRDMFPLIYWIRDGEDYDGRPYWVRMHIVERIGMHRMSKLWRVLGKEGAPGDAKDFVGGRVQRRQIAKNLGYEYREMPERT